MYEMRVCMRAFVFVYCGYTYMRVCVYGIVYYLYMYVYRVYLNVCLYTCMYIMCMCACACGFVYMLYHVYVCI
jgi:hypothetical protein